MYYRYVCGIFFAVFSSSALADLPLTVEDLITDHGRVKLDLSIAYANADRQNVTSGDPLIIQTGPASFVSVPTRVGDSVGNSDTMVATVGLRYGLRPDIEAYTRMSGLSTRQRSSDLNGTSENSDSRFADAWTGVNHQFKRDDESPAMLGFAEIALLEKHRHSSASFKSAMLGLTTYKAVDPVVFSLTGAYRFSQTRKDGNQDFKPGNLLLLNPSLAFAVNDRVTLMTGMQWSRRTADKFDGKWQGINRTSTELILGVGYGFDKGNWLNATFKINTTASSGSELRLNWLYPF